ncbi:hypothetical protein IFM89_007649 [Coptis chinensis]|uniref:Uncharacterized protein n=1 Tax=Coptis chinensis TaxID=261450 RepID=A0A835HWE9_9MAGN|nr:hypothetical protein IFM89_007649 [Coptis chinensis]
MPLDLLYKFDHGIFYSLFFSFTFFQELEKDNRFKAVPFKSFLNETESLNSKEATCSKSIVHIDRGRMGGYGYKESLLQFVESLGLTANKVAQQKIQECIIPPPNTDFQATHHKVIHPQPTTDLNFLGDDGQLESDDGCQQARCSGPRAMESLLARGQVALFKKGDQPALSRPYETSETPPGYCGTGNGWVLGLEKMLTTSLQRGNCTKPKRTLWLPAMSMASKVTPQAELGFLNIGSASKTKQEFNRIDIFVQYHGYLHGHDKICSPPLGLVLGRPKGCMRAGIYRRFASNVQRMAILPVHYRSHRDGTWKK